MAGKAFLVTGTDTSIGKTEVSCAIVRALAAGGRNVGVFKPAETGVPVIDGTPTGEDCVRLSAAADGRQSHTQVASYLFDLPAAPLVSAEAEKAGVDPQVLVRDCAAIRETNDITLVEGAGGLLVPIAKDYTYVNLAKDLDVPVLLVVGSRLGCINHALLTLEVLESRGLETIGYVINHLSGEPEDLEAAASNRDMIGRFSDAKDLGVLPFVPEGGEGDASGIDLAAIQSAAR